MSNANNKKFNKKTNGRAKGNWSKDKELDKGSRQGNRTSKHSTTDSKTGNDNCRYDHNDISWFFDNSVLLRNTASIPFSWRLGTDLGYPGVTALKDGDNEPVNPNWAIGSTAAIDFVPVVGTNDQSWSSPINIISSDLYAYVRWVNSGSRNYEQADLMMYILCLDSLYMLWSCLTRIYGTVFYYHVRNATLPRQLYSAMGLTDSIETIQTGEWLAKLRTYINIMATRLNVFAVPSRVNLYKRHMFLSQNIFVDGDSARAQYYVPTPVGFYKYVEMSSSGGRAVLRPRPTTIDTYIALADELLAAFNSSEDVGIISGDIIKAFGSDLFTVPFMDERYVITPIYDTAILVQFENATLVGSVKEAEIRQGANGLLYQYLDARGNPERTLFNAYSDNPTPEEVAYCTRLCACNDSQTNVWVGGSELVSTVRVYCGTADDTYVVNYDKNTYRFGPTHQSPEEVLKPFLAHRNFRHFPHLEVIVPTVNELGVQFAGLDYDLYNPAEITFDLIKNMSTVAWFTLLGGPYGNVKLPSNLT